VGQATPPSGNGYLQVSAGGFHSCALDPERSVVCWGNDGDGQATPPSGNGYLKVSAGHRHTCALEGDGRLNCWGSDLTGRASPPPGGGYKDVSAGFFHSCGIEGDDSIGCWGASAISESAPWNGEDTPLTVAAELRELVTRLYEGGVLSRGVADSLNRHVEGALLQWEQGRNRQAIQLLQPFIRQVTSLVGPFLTEEQARPLIEGVQRLVELIQE
jgi:hypothetical protein